jgi:glyoxalase family protein
MNQYRSGIHHITAIAGDPQKNVNFYTGILGLRMVKRTVNFDAPDTYHLYYGNGTGDPGTILTFFPWGKGAWQGRTGTGQVSLISFAIPQNAMGFWVDRLKQLNISIQGPFNRFEEEFLSFRDPDGIQLELVETSVDHFTPWEDGPINPENAIRGFYGITLAVEAYEKTAGLLTETFGFRHIGESGNRFRYQSDTSTVDLLCLPNEGNGRMGVGAVHHIAWRTPDESTQLKKREKLVELGYNVTPVIDRNYFHSIYFREPGGVLFEIATDPPGFLIDETLETLGTHLKLPEWYEPRRNEIESILPEITVSRIKAGVKVE